MNRLFKNKKVLTITAIVFIVVVAVIGITLQMSTPTTSPPQEIVSTNENPSTSQITSEEQNQQQAETETETAEMALAETTVVPDATVVVPSTPPEQTSPPTPLTILSISEGEVLVKRAGTNDWIPATVGMTLQPGDAIKSGGSSRAEVTFFEGSTVELDESTVLSMSDLGVSSSGSTTIGLVQQLGKTISRVQKLTDQESTYEIETPAAMAAVRGSTMVVTVLADGTTIVANEGGDIRVIAQGIELIIPEGMKSTIIPGSPPGALEPINPPPSGGGGGGTGGGGGGPVYTAKIDTSVSAQPLEAYVGDTVTYVYSISNTGNLQILSVSITDDIAGIPAYESGDNNTNSILDPGETWIFIAYYIIEAADESPLINNATFSATVSTVQTISTVDSAEVIILISEGFTILTESLPDGEVGASYYETLLVDGGTPDYSWSLPEGTLPDGLDLVDNTIVGTPTTAGTWDFTVQAIDSMENKTTRDYSITIVEALTITTDTLLDGETDVEYSQALITVNGAIPYTWSIINGSLPDGLGLDSSTGTISGIPTAAGTYNFIIRVTDSLGVTVTKSLVIIINSPTEK